MKKHMKLYCMEALPGNAIECWCTEPSLACHHRGPFKCKVYRAYPDRRARIMERMWRWFSRPYDMDGLIDYKTMTDIRRAVERLETYYAQSNK